MRAPGLGEILFILILVAVVFGASKVNPIGDAIGGFVRNLRRGLRNDDRIAVKPADPAPDDKPR
jgi:Sec-independent protein translocase protein TatA